MISLYFNVTDIVKPYFMKMSQRSSVKNCAIHVHELFTLPGLKISNFYYLVSKEYTHFIVGTSNQQSHTWLEIRMQSTQAYKYPIFVNPSC